MYKPHQVILIVDLESRVGREGRSLDGSEAGEAGEDREVLEGREGEGGNDCEGGGKDGEQVGVGRRSFLGSLPPEGRNRSDTGRCSILTPDKTKRLLLYAIVQLCFVQLCSDFHHFEISSSHTCSNALSF